MLCALASVGEQGLATSPGLLLPGVGCCGQQTEPGGQFQPWVISSSAPPSLPAAPGAPRAALGLESWGAGTGFNADKTQLAPPPATRLFSGYSDKKRNVVSK